MILAFGEVSSTNSRLTWGSCGFLAYQGRVSFRRTYVCSLYILVAEALNLILSILLIEADSSSSHNLTSALTVGIELHLKITERVVGGASIVV
jgi:hypothetical protein